MEFNRLRSPHRFAARRDQFKVVNVTKVQIEKQLAAVVELRDLNISFLEEAEKAWIASIVETALETLGEDVEWDEFAVERSIPSRSWLLDPLSRKQSRPLTRTGSPTGDELKGLLNAAKSLNAAMHLLSCCCERWIWMQSTKVPNGHLSRMSTDSREFLQRKRRTCRPTKAYSDPGQFPTHKCPTEEIASYGVLGSTDEAERISEDYDLDTHLSFFVIDTIGKWRQDAEDALTATTQRYRGRAPSIRLREHSYAANRTTVPGHQATDSMHSPTLIDVSLSAISDETPSRSIFIRPGERSTSTQSIKRGLGRHSNFIPSQKNGPGQTHVRQSSLGDPVQPYYCSSQSRLEKATRPSPYKVSLQNSFGKEPLDRVSLESPLLTPMQGSGLGVTLQSISSLSSASSAVFSQPTNMSTTSVNSNATESRPSHVSRGRAWLQLQSESDD